jgi:uncharacterized protein YrrD
MSAGSGPTTSLLGDGERLGVINDVMLDKRSGRIAYAVLSFGGFLGLGEQ